MDTLLKNNVLSLTALQVGNYLVPLTLLPYLTRVLGVEGFGMLGFATAFTVYFVLVVEWGFNLSSTREVSVNRNDQLARSKVFWDTLASRALLTLLSIVVVGLLVSRIPILNERSMLLWIGVLQILATSLSTTFYYQGIEKMRAMALINLGIRALSIPLTILLVREPDQLALAFTIQTGCFLLASLVNMTLLLLSNEIVWVRPEARAAWRSLASSSPLFLSYAATSLYTNSNVIILGLVASETAVGYFVAGFSLVRAVVGLSGPFAQAVFPRASLVLTAGSSDAGKFLRNMLQLQGLLGLALSMGLLLFLPWGVKLLYGSEFGETVHVVAWLSALPMIICLASVMGMQTLVPLGHHRWYSGVLLTCGLVNCLVLATMGYLGGATGAAMAVVMTEFAILFGMTLGVKRHAPQIWQDLIRHS